MATKGASNRYGNTKNGKQGHKTQYIGFAWAKSFEKYTEKKAAKKSGRVAAEGLCEIKTDGYTSKGINRLIHNTEGDFYVLKK